MIKATFFNDSSGIIRGFSLIGHAEYAEYGSDIVCAGVSTLAINTINSIKQLTNDSIVYNIDEDTGLLTMTFDSDVSDKSKLLIDSLILGLQGIVNEYNDNTYLKILFKEV